MSARARAAASAFVLAAACSSALNEPSPIASYAPGRVQGRTADQLVAEANAAWARRAQPGQAAAAQDLYLDAAVLDEQRVDAVLGAMRALSFRIEFEQGAPRGSLAGEQVELGQWCRRRAPAEPECDYRLAIALGQQARERPSTGLDAMTKMQQLLDHAIATAPRLDSGGPDRVLALLYLRAPSWPTGPGDAGAGLDHARAAAKHAISGEESIMNYIRTHKDATTQDIKKHWGSEGRGGTADNALSKLVREKKIRRFPLEDRRGSRFAV